MAALSSWVSENWFNIVQTSGIVGSLLFTAIAAQRDAKSREIENLLALSTHHRELWNEARKNAGLRRIFQSDTDVLTTPITIAEKEFLNLAIVHFQTGWRFAKSGGLVTLEELKRDARDFFSLPLPKAVLAETKASRNAGFVRFVKKAVAS